MAYLHPQAESQFLPFPGKHLSEGLGLYHSSWMGRLFKGDLLTCVEGLEPTGYYLNDGRPEPSLLLYKGECQQWQFSIQENFNVVFLTVKPSGFDPQVGVTAAEIRHILVKWTNIGDSGLKEFVGDYGFRDILHVGDIFSNNPGRSIQRITDWRKDVVGFVSVQGVCFLFFTVDPDAPRAEIGFSSYPDWVNKGLLDEDGKTLVDRRFTLSGPDALGSKKEQAEVPKEP